MRRDCLGVKHVLAFSIALKYVPQDNPSPPHEVVEGAASAHGVAVMHRAGMH